MVAETQNLEVEAENRRSHGNIAVTSTVTRMAIPLKTAGPKVVVKKAKGLVRKDLLKRGRNPKLQQLLLRMTSYLLLSVPPTLPKWQMHSMSQNQGLV